MKLNEIHDLWTVKDMGRFRESECLAINEALRSNDADLLIVKKEDKFLIAE